MKNGPVSQNAVRRVSAVVMLLLRYFLMFVGGGATVAGLLMFVIGPSGLAGAIALGAGLIATGMGFACQIAIDALRVPETRGFEVTLVGPSSRPPPLPPSREPEG